MLGYVSDPETMATVDGREYRADPGAYVQNGERVTKSTALDTRGAGELKCGRASFPARGGKGRTHRDARGLSAVTAHSTRMNPTGWNMKRDRQDRKVTTTTIPAAKLAAMRAERGL